MLDLDERYYQGKVNTLLTDIVTGLTYLLLKLIRFGGQGGVFQALEKRSQKIFALKLQTHISPNEARVLQVYIDNQDSMNYNVKMFSQFEKESHKCIIMEYANGGNLLDYMKSQNLEQSEKREIMRQLSKGVEELHKLNLIHRDIKQENVVIFEDGNGNKTYKLCDIGLVRIQSDNFIDNLKIGTGTEQYMAPEMFVGTDYNETIDIWALSILFLKILSGQDFYREDASIIASLTKQFSNNPNTLLNRIKSFNVPAKDEALIIKMLAITVTLNNAPHLLLFIHHKNWLCPQSVMQLFSIISPNQRPNIYSIVEHFESKKGNNSIRIVRYPQNNTQPQPTKIDQNTTNIQVLPPFKQQEPDKTTSNQRIRKEESNEVPQLQETIKQLQLELQTIKAQLKQYQSQQIQTKIHLQESTEANHFRDIEHLQQQFKLTSNQLSQTQEDQRNQNLLYSEKVQTLNKTIQELKDTIEQLNQQLQNKIRKSLSNKSFNNENPLQQLPIPSHQAIECPPHSQNNNDLREVLVQNEQASTQHWWIKCWSSVCLLFLPMF